MTVNQEINFNQTADNPAPIPGHRTKRAQCCGHADSEMPHQLPRDSSPTPPLRHELGWQRFFCFNLFSCLLSSVVAAWGRRPMKKELRMAAPVVCPSRWLFYFLQRRGWGEGSKGRAQARAARSPSTPSTASAHTYSVV